MKGILALVACGAILTGIAAGTPTRAGAAPHASAVLYHATQITPPAGFDSIIVTDLNNVGQLSGRGRKTSDMTFHALRRTGTTWEDLGEGTAVALNDSGVCVGFDNAGAAKWVGPNRTALPGFAFAQDINNAGDILVQANGPSGSFPRIILADTTVVTIPPLNSSFPSFNGRAINSSRQVTGDGQIDKDVFAPYRFDNAATSNLNAGLGEVIEGIGLGINDGGTVCGYYRDPTSGGLLACTWSGPGGINFLETPGKQESFGLGINSTGTVVGQLFDGETGTPAVWNGGVFQNLNSVTSPGSLGLGSADRINNPGTILAHKHVMGSGNSYFILTPVPPNPLPDFRATFGVLTSKCSGTGTRRQCTISGKLTVTNAGTLKNKPAKLELFGSTDTTLGGDSLLKTLTVPALKPGTSKDLQVSGAKFARGVPSTGKFLIGVIDGANQVAELDETNNTLVSTALP